MAQPLGSSLLGGLTFCAKQHGAGECDSKGLPLTLNTTNILGKFERLKALSHPNLTCYLEAQKLKNERVILVSEWHEDCLEQYLKSDKFSSVSSLACLARKLLSALAYLEGEGITHRALEPRNILVTPEGDIKLHNYGFYYLTENGSQVDFPVGTPRYLAPEVIISGPNCVEPCGPKVDVWSLGIILFELFAQGHVYPDLSQGNAVGMLLKRVILLLENYQKKSVGPLSTLLEMHNCANKDMNSDFRSFLTDCLIPVPSLRPTAKALLQHPFIVNHTPPPHRRQDSAVPPVPYPFLPSPFSSLLRCSALPLQSGSRQGVGPGEELISPDHLRERPLKEVFYLWSLAGGDIESELKKADLIQSKPPIFAIPSVVTNNADIYGTSQNRTLFDTTVVQLPLEQLRKRLENMTTEDYYPLLETPTEDTSGPLKHHDQEFLESSKLPLAIKEKDVEYQFHRTIIFSRLLESYPYSAKLILSEAVVDVCPLFRGEIWAAILGVRGDIEWQYSNIDKDSLTSTDRQIDVDIPRCHQYDVLLSSRVGHRKFKRVLKSWVVSHTHLVYWQGLDSLCAPFLALNFNNEALAYACLSAFIDRFLHKFFLKDNSPVMQEYLAVFSQLISFHDPMLYNHLDEIGFFPELYAIPWFLTMFTHILPLEKIYHLWDTMLLGNSSFPLFVGLAILHQLRDDILSFEFNDCILMFSDMPVIDIQACILTAIKLFQATPTSLYTRLHQQGPVQSEADPTEPGRPPLPLATLKSEACPQISSYDFIVLCQLESFLPNTLISWKGKDSTPSAHSSLLLQRNFASGGKGKKKARPKGFVVDIRSNEEFRQGHVPNSISLPHDSAFAADGSLAPSKAAVSLSAVGGKILCVVGNKGDAAASTFGRRLVSLGFQRVCVVYGGAGLLRSLGLLSSLQDDV